jgi:hypothetical protein
MSVEVTLGKPKTILLVETDEAVRLPGAVGSLVSMVKAEEDTAVPSVEPSLGVIFK